MAVTLGAKQVYTQTSPNMMQSGREDIIRRVEDGQPEKKSFFLMYFFNFYFLSDYDFPLASETLQAFDIADRRLGRCKSQGFHPQTLQVSR